MSKPTNDDDEDYFSEYEKESLSDAAISEVDKESEADDESEVEELEPEELEVEEVEQEEVEEEPNDSDIEEDYDQEGEGEEQEQEQEEQEEERPRDEDEDDDEDEDEDALYLQKFDKAIQKNYMAEIHPECAVHNYEEIAALTNIIRDRSNNIIDPLHRTLPFLTKYERTRIIGMRAKQINSGAKPFIKVPENVIDGYLIAEMELKEKRVPFILRRPLPGGGMEYWNVRDLEQIV